MTLCGSHTFNSKTLLASASKLGTYFCELGPDCWKDRDHGKRTETRELRPSKMFHNVVCPCATDPSETREMLSQAWNQQNQPL